MASRRPDPPRALRSLRGVLIAALLGTARPAPAEDPGSATGCVVPVFVDDDATLRRAYDGLRLGLEEANLPRACIEAPRTDDAAGWAAVAAATGLSSPPFVVALGRRAGAAVAAAPFTTPAGRRPCVYVDVALSVGFGGFPEAPRRPGRHAVVRADVPLERVGRLLADLLPGRATRTALLPWTATPPAVAAWLARAEGPTGVRWSTDASVPPDVIVDAAADAGETREPFGAALARARSLRVPLVSLDRARFGEGAAVVVVPDAALLGRVAAEAARRLVAGEGDPDPVRLSVRTTEVWVDLDAAAAEGLDPPLPFLARADRVRRAPPKPAGPPR